MGFLSGILSATIKVGLTPIAIVKDMVDVTTGDSANNTKRLIEKAGDDLSDATDDLCDGDLI